MSTYVMSDIHGHKKLFDKMLNKIHFDENDTLYILGDCIDRGPEGIKILLKVMRTRNIKMLMGNHEFMMLETLTDPDAAFKESEAIWFRNGGQITLNSFNKYSENTKKRIINYIKKLPYDFDITVNGRNYILCHASPMPDRFKINPMETHYYGTRYDTYEEFAVWNRDFPFIKDENFKDKTVIFGHTPVQMLNIGDSKNPQMVRYKNSIDIDCGCACIGIAHTPAKLACLRLDDMKAFYVSPEDTKEDDKNA